jgi:hypothetical protein
MEDWGDRLQKKETKSTGITNLDILKELLDNPRVEKVSIDYTKVGEVGIAKIEADLKGDELKCHYKREVHKKLYQTT